MGQLKFYKAGYANFEAQMFGTTSYTISSPNYKASPDRTLTYSNTTSDLSNCLYSSKNLSYNTVDSDGNGTAVPVTSYKYALCYSSSGDGNALPFRFCSGIKDYHAYKGTSNTTHNSSNTTFTNVVCDVEEITSTIINGTLGISLTLTNNGSSSVTVNSIEKSGYGGFCNTITSGSSNYGWCYYLDWAYYLGDEAVTLAAGEGKTITINIKLADLTL